MSCPQQGGGTCTGGGTGGDTGGDTGDTNGSTSSIGGGGSTGSISGNGTSMGFGCTGLYDDSLFCEKLKNRYLLLFFKGGTY